MADFLSRRTVLKGILGGTVVSLGLPALEIFLNSHGSAFAEDGPAVTGFPRRFGLFFWGNGVLPDRWVPTGEGTEWEASEQLQPVYHLKDVITIVSGMRLGVPNTAPHTAGAGGILTGSPVLNPYDNVTFAGPTIDQIIAKKTGEDTRFGSLEFGAGGGSGQSHNGPNSKNPSEESPFALFERVFGAGFQLPGEEPVIDPTLALRRSVLDAVMEDIQRLNSRIGAADAIRLEQHLDGVRSLEKRIAKLEEDPPNLAACALPTQPEADYPEIEGRPQLRLKNQVFSEIIAYALACDQTRVFSNFFSKPLNNFLFEGAPAGHHQMTHDEPGDQPECHKITLQCIEALAVQIEALRNIAEGDGTLLDSCLVLGTSEVSWGKTHSLDEFPIVLAGSCGGKIKTGIHYRSAGQENASKALLSICRAMGLDLAEFGTEGGRTSEGLGAIEV
ncbi:MAG: hypothetical protein CMH54_12365 [Myxococcales bacterium]|nr:hypothetical protein [Myxococcales bacterium]